MGLLWNIIVNIKAWWYSTIWSVFYDWFSNSIDYELMNWGYHNALAENSFNDGNKEAFKQELYSKMIENINMKKKERHKLLEIGCGKGGGMKHLINCDKLNSKMEIVGIDISNANVLHASKLCNHKMVKFFRGSALDLQSVPALKKIWFDYIINVESSHCYGDFNLFVENAYSVLKTGGIFSICDMRLKPGWNTIEELFKNSNKWKIIELTDITENVIKSCTMSSSLYKNAEKGGTLFGLWNYYWCTTDSENFKGLIQGKREYKLIRVQKL
eukprot:41075_1